MLATGICSALGREPSSSRTVYGRQIVSRPGAGDTSISRLVHSHRCILFGTNRSESSLAILSGCPRPQAQPASWRPRCETKSIPGAAYLEMTGGEARCTSLLQPDGTRGAGGALETARKARGPHRQSAPAGRLADSGAFT